MFSWTFPYPSQRMPVLARNAVATSQPLAAQAGLRMLQKGGNAVDAALAAAIALTVVEPASNGLGSDAFAIVWDGHRLHGLNASGRSPAAWQPHLFADCETMPVLGWNSVTVPGAVSAWVALSHRFGRLPFEELFEPAVAYAASGFLVSPIIAQQWQGAVAEYQDYPDFAATFLPEGRAPRAGERVVLPQHEYSLRRIAETRGEAFYQGELAGKIVAHSAAGGGLLTLEDMASHHCDWVDTISNDYRGLTLHEIPPNGQGLAALLALGILRHWPLEDFPVDSAASVHLQLEAMKLALADAHRYVADPAAMDVSCEALLSEEYSRERAKLIDLKQAGHPHFGTPPAGDTVYLTAGDADGMMVSFIQSNYYGFGSGIVVPGTGISLQNRGYGFTLEPGHPNQVGGGKRPFHTIIPAFVMQGAEPLMSYGVMGGPMQAQGHVQMLTRLADYGQNPQAAADAPHWQVLHGREIAVEAGFAPAVLEDLVQRGHQIRFLPGGSFGGAQLLYKLDGGYCAASDHRKDGQAVGY
ncbi:MAG TPA: gamma-glutamyltransferase family protein [Abditibacteriaceae bacterium]|nr:gamma-glutamyltransferase family protein [Abditibacteriaceae bacterium]